MNVGSNEEGSDPPDAGRAAAGPLRGLRVVEIAGIGPGPFCGMMLAGLGAEVLRIERPGADAFGQSAVLNRGRPALALDLKSPAGADALLGIIEKADALFEGFRPGVMERLGLGPETCLSRNPRLVYGRVTGWGQEGPFAQAAGHDLNYLALSGMLWPLGPAERPPLPPLNLVADFGGGGMLLLVGLLSALLEARISGRGQVVDAAMVDGAASLGAMIFGWVGSGSWRLERETNMLDGGAPFYAVYETADGGWVSIGALEPHFYRRLLQELGLDEARFANQWNRDSWPALKQALAATFRAKTRESWCRAFEGIDVCFAPVLDPLEAAAHPHAKARQAFFQAGGVAQPSPAPRFSRTPATPSPGTAPAQSHDPFALLRRWRVEGDVSPLAPGSPPRP